MKARTGILGLGLLSVLIVFVSTGAGQASRGNFQQAEGRIIVEPADGLRTSEDGGSDGFTIRLSRRPDSAVRILLESSDETEGTISKDSVILNPGNWDNPQTVTIYGVDDQEMDGDISYRIITRRAISNDNDYDNVDPPDVSVVNLDNDEEDDQTPVARDDDDSTSENESVTTDVLANDSGLGNEPLTVILVDDPQHGTADVLPNLHIEYSPQDGFSGSDDYRYRVCDRDDDCSSARVMISVDPTNAGPHARDDNASTTADTPVTIAVLANDNDPDGDTIILQSFATTSERGGTIVRDTNGTPDDRSDDRLIYTPPNGYEGSDLFRYSISDGSLNDIARVNVSISPANQDPIANNDNYGTNANTTLHVPANAGVLANDSDPEGLGLTAQRVSGPSHGDLDLNSDGSFTYTPQNGFTGTDRFTYQASDGSSDSNTAEVEISITDQSAPHVEWLNPVRNEEIYYTQALGERVTLQVRAEDNISIDRVRFLRWDGVKEEFVELGNISDSPFGLELDTSSLNPDWNQIFAIAHDQAGNASQRQFIWIFRKMDGAFKMFLPALRN